jgi:LysM repeat protein
MRRLGLVAITGALAALPLVVAACGPDTSGADLLPPILTTTTTTTIATTTTEYVPFIYVIQSGDQLGNIATSFGVDMAELMALNDISDPNNIQAGQNLEIPPATVANIVDTLPAP